MTLGAGQRGATTSRHLARRSSGDDSLVGEMAEMAAGRP